MSESPSDSPRTDPDTPEPVVVGAITGAWGLAGQVKVRSHSDEPRRFAKGGIVYLGGRPARIISSRVAGTALVIKFDLVEDRSHAESLRGEVLTVRPEDLGPLPPGSYYHYQIIGMDVRDEAGARLGAVTEVLTTGANDVYVVRDGKRETLVPATAEVLVSVDTDRNSMVVRLPEGL